MKNKAKLLLIGTALLTVTAGSVIAFGGPGYCNQNGGPMYGQGQYGQMQGRMQGRVPGGMQGFKQGGPMQGIFRLNNLTAEQRDQLSELRRTQQELMQGKRAEMQAQRELMKQKVDAILTAEQRETLSNMNSSNYGRRGNFGG